MDAPGSTDERRHAQASPGTVRLIQSSILNQPNHRDRLRGALFETWVVSEIVKHRRNRGETGGLSFYRDRHANETDLIVESADHLTLVEAKSARTASSALFDGLRRVKELLSQPSRPCGAALVYGGEEPQTRSDASLVPWTRLHEEEWSRAG